MFNYIMACICLSLLLGAVLMAHITGGGVNVPACILFGTMTITCRMDYLDEKNNKK